MVGEQKRDDMAQKTNQNQAPLLCSTGCGFNASPSNNGMCSVCYKDFLQRQSSSTQASPPGSSCCTEAQSSDSTTVSSPAAISPTDTECSEEMTASVNPTEASTSQGSCSLPTADDYCEAVKADEVVSQLEDESSAGSSGTGKSENSISVSQSSDEGKKRKFKDPTKNKEVYEASSSETSAEPITEQEEKPKSTKKRCFVCRKKVGLSVLGFDCRCGKVFCSLHRYSDVHNCTFDYKADAAEKIRRENPVVIGEKIQKI